jgi:hypothetical protein
MPRCRPVSAGQRSSAINHQLRSPAARGDGDLPLLKAFKGAILAPKSLESGECRLMLRASGRPEISIVPIDVQTATLAEKRGRQMPRIRRHASLSEAGWRLFAHLLLMLAYIVTGKLALLLAVPPGYASPIFPPAGIAVAATLIGGPATLPWIFLGSLLLNVWTGYSVGHRPDEAECAAAIVIAAASMGQALVGGSVLRRAIGYPVPLNNSRDLSLFLLLSPLFCLTRATLSLAGLSTLGIVHLTDLATSWISWWIGDTLGVLLVLPLMLVLAGEPRALPLRRSPSGSLADAFVLRAFHRYLHPRQQVGARRDSAAIPASLPADHRQDPDRARRTGEISRAIGAIFQRSGGPVAGRFSAPGSEHASTRSDDPGGQVGAANPVTAAGKLRGHSRAVFRDLSREIDCPATACRRAGALLPCDLCRAPQG